MKRFVAILAAAAALGAGLGMTGCGEDKVIKIGVTDYEPMNYLDENKNWTGFDTELAEKVFSELGYTVVFELIDWETKIVTLKSGDIDVIWNGMTITDELQENLLLSDVYLENRQYGIVKTEYAANYSSPSDLTGKKVAFEAGSAAEGLLADIGCTKNGLATQNAAVMEVAAGTSDIGVIDYLMATALTTNASSDYYGKLTAVDLGFEPEEFAVGFRKDDTELCEQVNEQIAKLTKSGYMRELAEKYGIENQLKA